jgi:hypothetical protein
VEKVATHCSLERKPLQDGGEATAGAPARKAHLAIASSVTHSVRLPRRQRPASYEAQFLILNFIFPNDADDRRCACSAQKGNPHLA